MRIGIRLGRAGALLNISGQAREVGVPADPELQLTQMEMPSQWYASGKPGISANRYVAGTGWGTAESIIDSGNTSYSQGVQIAFDKNGNAIAVWNQYGGKLYTNRYVTGTGWGTTDIVVQRDKITPHRLHLIQMEMP